MICELIFFAVVTLSSAQTDNGTASTIPLSPDSFRPLFRTLLLAPPGRVAVLSDIMIRLYHTNLTSPTSTRIDNVEMLLDDPDFDVNRPTVLYAHGYIELSTDESVQTVISAYIRRGGYNVLLLDWSNIAYGNYVIVAKRLPSAGEYVGRGLQKLLNGGLSLEQLHFVGHSLGSHLVAYVARYLANNGFKLPRLTGLDPAFPGFYPPLLAPPMAPTDADFVDVIHTDGGKYGTPISTGQADFWPNGGVPVQPGCPPITIPLTIEDFCSHWRSWQLWAESLTSDSLLARHCENYDSFLNGDCQNEPVVKMGINASPDSRGNYYLKTAASSPYGLGLDGVN